MKTFTERELIYPKGANRPREIVTITDKAGNVLHKTIKPIMLLFKMRDVVQMIVGATLLAIPLAYTAETWILGEELGIYNVLALWVLSIIFISLFMYHNIYRNHFKSHIFEFVKRIIGVYIIAFCVVAIFLTIIDKAPWSTDLILTIKRIIIISVPASLSAAVTDLFK